MNMSKSSSTELGVKRALVQEEGDVSMVTHRKPSNEGLPTHRKPSNSNPAPSSSYVTPMLTDFYQLTMAYAYWNNGQHEDNAVFELFFRKNPFKGEFTIFAGLSEVLRFVKHFKFTQEDIAYMKTLFPPHTSEAFFSYLSELDCSQVTIHAMTEGTVVFPRTPLIRLEGPLLICQLLETTILNLTNFPSLICTNAARMRLAAGEDKVLLEFGLRRAQGPDGGMSASRYSYMGGFDGSSNVLAGMTFGLEIKGTHAHSFISSFKGEEDLLTRKLLHCEDFLKLCKQNLDAISKELNLPKSNPGELVAFVCYAQAFPDKFNALVDTYDTLKSGIPNFLAVAVALQQHVDKHAIGIRLDSGDLAFLSLEARSMFAEVGRLFQIDLSYLKIMASNDINERILASLEEQGHSIDIFGIGTNLVTCQSQPALGMVYKLVEIKGKPAIKLSNEFEKQTIPGKKFVYRLIGADGIAMCDVMTTNDEHPPQVGQKLLCQHPTLDRKRAYVTPSFVIDLLRPVFIGPHNMSSTEPELKAIQQHVKDQLTLIRSDYKRSVNPSEYKVSVTTKLFNVTKDLWNDHIPIPELQ